MKRTITIAIVLVLLMLLLGWWITGETDVAPDATGTANGTGDDSVRVSALPRGDEPLVSILNRSGDVRVKVEGEDWKPATVGQLLPVDAEVETGVAAGVTLKVGELSTVEMMNDARVTVRELSESVQRMGLLSGRVSVNYEEKGDRVLQIENADGSAVARVRKGRFSMMNNGTVVAVAAETGTVDLSAAGQTVTVSSGMQSHTTGDEAPVRPGTVSAQMMLRLSDKACTRHKNAAVKVKGVVEPGTRVFVNRQPARVNAAGHFVADLVLEAGRSRIVIETEDVVGRRMTRSVSCIIVDSASPDSREVDFKWGVTKGKKAS